jgi:type IV secretory pathway VirB2 component (pilin)
LSGGWLYSHTVSNWFLYALAIFLATFSVYNLQRIYKFKKNRTLQTKMYDWLRERMNWMNPLAMICGILALLLSAYLVKDILSNLWLFILTVLVSIFYVVPFFGKRLREVPFLKTFLIAIVWTCVLFYIPWLNECRKTELVQNELTAYFFLFSALTIPFDIRDMEQDRMQHTTLPLYLGVKISKLVSIAFLAIFYVIIANINQEIGKNLLLACVTVITALLILFVNSTRSIYFFAAIDGTMVLIGLVYFYS